MIGNGHAGFGRAASEKDPQGHLADVVPRHAAIPARLRRNGPGNGFAKRCAHGERATALRRRPTTGRAPTHADAAPRRSHDYKPENGPHRPLSSICTGAGRRPSRTPSAAPERSGVNAVDIRTRGSRLTACERERLRSPRRFCHCVRRGGATPRARGRLSGAAGCTQPTIQVIAGGHGHAVGAAIATVAYASRRRPGADDR